jgi:hypothetical protein
MEGGRDGGGRMSRGGGSVALSAMVGGRDAARRQAMAGSEEELEGLLGVEKLFRAIRQKHRGRRKGVVGEGWGREDVGKGSGM